MNIRWIPKSTEQFEKEVKLAYNFCHVRCMAHRQLFGCDQVTKAVVPRDTSNAEIAELLRSTFGGHRSEERAVTCPECSECDGTDEIRKQEFMLEWTRLRAPDATAVYIRTEGGFKKWEWPEYVESVADPMRDAETMRDAIKPEGWEDPVYDICRMQEVENPRHMRTLVDEWRIQPLPWYSAPYHTWEMNAIPNNAEATQREDNMDTEELDMANVTTDLEKKRQ